MSNNPAKPFGSVLLRRDFLTGMAVLSLPVACSSSDSSDGSGGTTASGGQGGGAGQAGSGGTGGQAGSGGQAGGAGQGGAGGAASKSSNIANLGPLEAADKNGVRLPSGFTSRIVAESGKAPVKGGSYVWHGAPDGGAVFNGPAGGWIYVSNSEISGTGGVGALVFDKNGNVIDAYAICKNTNRNCAGGITPWGTWLTCEETSNGQVYECDPSGQASAKLWPALGTFAHEAVAVDPKTQHLFLTEDRSDGRFYRFVPDNLKGGFADLSAGKLQVATVTQGKVTWTTLPDPEAKKGSTRSQIPSSTAFNGGEGIWYHDGTMYFATKGDNRIWAYDIAAAKISIFYEKKTSTNPILSGVDNVTVSCCGDVLVAEDGGDLEIVALLPNGTPKSLIKLEGHGGSEITGPAFDPSLNRLYFSSQRGTNGSGITFEVSGPFHV